MKDGLSGDHVILLTPARSTSAREPSKPEVEAMVTSRPSERRGPSPTQFLDIEADVDSGDDVTDSDDTVTGRSSSPIRLTLPW